MYFERSTNSMQATQLRSRNASFNHSGETFHDILQRSLNSKSNSRPPKIDVTGILVPVSKEIGNRIYKFKLEADSNEYLLHLNNTLESIARKIEWEEVTVRGHLDLDSNVLEVEKMTVSQAIDPIKAGPLFEDQYFGADFYERAIVQRGKLEPVLDYLAS